MWVPLLNETFAKTWMNGVFKPSHRAVKKLKQSNIINKISLSPSLSSSLSSISIIARSLVLPEFLEILIIFECFLLYQLITTITVLMNDFRLKAFYCKTSSKRINKTSVSVKQHLLSISTSSSTLNTSLYAAASSAGNITTPLATTLSSSIRSIKSQLKTCNNNKNHLRTYNNSSKSNKVFLYYTPRDPRLRIFQKTKKYHRLNRPQCYFNPYFHSKFFHSLYDNNFSNNSHLKITDDLCNYGELIGGCGTSGEISVTSGVKQKHSVTIFNKTALSDFSKNCDKIALNEIQKELSDKRIVVVATLTVIFDRIGVVIISISSIGERHLAEFLLTYIGAVLSIFLTITQKQGVTYTVLNLITQINKSFEKI